MTFKLNNAPAPNLHFPQCNLILYNLKRVLTQWYVIWNMITRRVSEEYVALCRIEHLQAFRWAWEIVFFFLLHLCVHLVWQRSFEIGWLFSILFPFNHFFWSIFSSLQRCTYLLTVLSALLCVPFQATIWSPSAFSWSFFYVIDPYSSMQVCAWCSFYWLSDWQKLFKLFFFFFLINSEL